MLQDRESCDRSLPWVKVGLRTLGTILHHHASTHGHPPPQILSVERMVQGAIRAFQLDAPAAEDSTKPGELPEESQSLSALPTNPDPPLQAGLSTGAPLPSFLDNPSDGGNVDLDWNIDFGAMDMEAFLSVDVTRDFTFGL